MRLLFLDAHSGHDRADAKSASGRTMKEQIESDLKLELGAVKMYNHAVQVSRDEGDNASRELFERLLKDEEAHVDWLEAQVHQIKEMGYERYLGQQIKESK